MENPSGQQKSVQIIIPVYNEAEALGTFHASLVNALADLSYHFEIIYINDGSSDATQEVLAGFVSADQRVQVIELSRNFGHQSALTAGLDIADADYVISMDGDGQHPPALLAEMLKLAESGYDIVLTQRTDELNLPPFKRMTSQFFYTLINAAGNTKVLPGGADFRLMSAAAVEGLRQMPEYHRFLRGMVAWLGFKSVVLPFQPAARVAGKSKYSLKKMWQLAMNAIFSFSLVPLYSAITLGVIFLVLAVIEALYVLSFWLTGNTAPLAPGWSSLMFVLLVVGGFLMIAIGVVGVYIGYIFQEVKGRPSYVVRSHLTHDSQPR